MRPSTERATSGTWWILAQPLLAALVALLALVGDGPAQDKASPKKGLILNKPGALQGYTVLSPIMSNKAYLLDMDGRVVHTWESESSAALSTYLLENGHLLRHAKLSEQLFGDGAGAGGHIQEFTWDGDLAWDFRYASPTRLAHHDVCKMPNGNVLLISWEKKTAAEAIAAGRRPETVGNGYLLPDCIVEVQPTGKTTGKVVWEWHIWDHLIQDHDQTKANYGDVKEHPELVDVNFGEGAIAAIVAKKDELDKLRAIGYVGAAGPDGRPAPVRADWLHTNAVAYNPELDQILMSIHEFSEFWVIDHSTTTAEAKGHVGGRAGRGGDLLYRYGNPRAYRRGTVKDQKLFGQHNAHWIPKGLPGAGHVLVFNNGVRRPGGAHSTVDELVLPVLPDGRYECPPGGAFGPDKPVWSYAAPKRTEFYSSFISGANRLPNGNTFICSGETGTIFEVTPNKEVVWKYVNPAKPNPMALGARPKAVDVLPRSLRDALELSDAQRERLDALQKEVEGKLQALLTEEQRKRLEAPPPGPPPGTPGSQQAPRPAQVLAGALRQQARLTDKQKEEVEGLQKQVEENVNQVLTDAQKKQLKDLVASFINAWPGGPPPGGPPPGGRGPGGPLGGPPPGGRGPGGSPGGGGGPQLQAAVFRSYRYAADYPGLAGKTLTPGKTVEEMQGPAGK